MQKKFKNTIRITIRAPSDFEEIKYILMRPSCSTTIYDILPDVKSHFDQTFQEKDEKKIDWERMIFVKWSQKYVKKYKPLSRREVSLFQKFQDIFQNEDDWNYCHKINIVPKKIERVIVSFQNYEYPFYNVPWTERIQNYIFEIQEKIDFQEDNFLQMFIKKKMFTPSIYYENIKGKRKQVQIKTHYFEDHVKNMKKTDRQIQSFIFDNHFNGIFKTQLVELSFNYYEGLRLFFEGENFESRINYQFKTLLKLPQLMD